MPVAVATDFSALSQLAVALCPSNANIPINGQAEAGAIKKAVVGENHAQLPRQAKVAKVVKAAKAVQRDMPSVKAFYTINRQLNLLLATRPPIKSSISIKKCCVPSKAPKLWVSKWIDHSQKHGFGYKLSNGIFGATFHDSTIALLSPDAKTLHYIYKDTTSSHVVGNHPAKLNSRLKFLNVLRDYMEAYLRETGLSASQENHPLPYVRMWWRTSCGLMMLLSTDALQVNFFKEHVKMLICPRMGTVTVMRRDKTFRTYGLSLLAKHGCTEYMYKRLLYIQLKAAGMKSSICQSNANHQRTSTKNNEKVAGN